LPATILLVDDHPVFRQGLYHLLSKEKDLTVVGEAADGRMAIEQVKQKKPDLVVMDINMPNIDGIEATRKIMAAAPQTRVVALSVHSGKQFVRDMIKAGASGYILKESIPEEMVAGIRMVLAGDIYLSRSISKVLVSDYKALASESEPEDVNRPKSILYTKLHRPPITAAIIPRTRLLEMMENSVQYSMTLIAAPAGYGKSTLASGWLGVSQWKGAWVSLGADDNNLRVFLSYVIEAIQGVVACHELKTKALVMGGKLPSAKEVGQFLLNDLETCSETFVLVLDDYHLIRNDAIHDFIIELLIHPSPAMHLVLVTRRDPPLPLASLHARGVLTEITMADLRFTPMETQAYLERFLRIPIAHRTARILEDKMEGWVTGLHLAALSMRDEPDQNRLIDGMQGTSLYVQEYLLQEVLSKAPPVFRRHLLQTAILNRFCAPLCDVLMTGVSDESQTESPVHGQEFIDWLVTRHFFIIPLDTTGRWFRYHHLFQQLLQDQLNRHQPPETIAGLHSRASDWLAQNQFIEDAIRHAIAAGEPMKAVRIVEQNRQTVLNEDRWYVFETWLPMLPDDVICKSPGLLMAQTWLLYHHFEVSKIPSVLDAAEALLGDPQDEKSDERSIQGEIDFFRGYFYYFQNDGTASLKHLTDARERVPETHHEIRGQIEILIGLAMQMQGQPEAALAQLNGLLDHPQWEKSVARTRLLITVVYIQIISGSLDKATVANQRLYDVASKNHYAYVKAWSLYLSGLIHFYRNEREDAIDCFSQAIEQKHILHTRAVIDSMVGLVLAYQAIEDAGHAAERFNSLYEYAGTINDPSAIMLADSCRARLAIMQGKQKTVYDLLRSDSPPAENMVWWLEIPVVTYCRGMIAQGSPQRLEESETMLRELLQLSQDNHNTCHMIQVITLQALVFKKQDRIEEALRLLKEAIELAAPGGWIYPFVEAGPPIAEMLKQLPAQKMPVDFMQKLTVAFDDNRTPPDFPEHPSPLEVSSKSPSAPTQPLVEPLTNRELDVLELLSQRLQNKEIADKLFITTETVKGHLKNIYQKLGVSNRRKAVEEAKRIEVI